MVDSDGNRIIPGRLVIITITPGPGVILMQSEQGFMGRLPFKPASPIFILTLPCSRIDILGNVNVS